MTLLILDYEVQRQTKISPGMQRRISSKGIQDYQGYDFRSLRIQGHPG